MLSELRGLLTEGGILALNYVGFRTGEGSDADGFTITDDYNPMESRQVRKSEAYRKLFLERIAFDLLLR
jgi:hypothetical protein